MWCQVLWFKDTKVSFTLTTDTDDRSETLVLSSQAHQRQEDGNLHKPITFLHLPTLRSSSIETWIVPECEEPSHATCTDIVYVSKWRSTQLHTFPHSRHVSSLLIWCSARIHTIVPCEAILQAADCSSQQCQAFRCICLQHGSNGGLPQSVKLISIVIPTTCTNVWNLFYFGKTLYMFYCCLLASKQTAVSV